MADAFFAAGGPSDSAMIDGLGQPGARMHFFMARTNAGFRIPTRFLQHSFLHQFGHYGFGLYDEYLGFIRTSAPAVVNNWITQNYAQNPQPSTAVAADYWGWVGGGDAAKTAGRIFFSANVVSNIPLTFATGEARIMNVDNAADAASFSWDGDYPFNLMTVDAGSGLILPGHWATLSRVTSSRDGATLLAADRKSTRLNSSH